LAGQAKPSPDIRPFCLGCNETRDRGPRVSFVCNRCKGDRVSCTRRKDRARRRSMTDTKQPTEGRVVLPVDPTRRTEIDKQRVPMSARPYRLLALVKQDAVVRVQKEPDDTVMTWPHLLTIEFLAAGMMSVFLLLMGLFINAPLEELA